MDTWAVVGISVAFVVLTMMFLMVRRAEGTTRNPLPALDRTPRTATAIGWHPAPQSRIRFGTDEPRGTRMIEVEYVDDTGAVRRELLADLFAGAELDPFVTGSTWQVYGFEKPHGRCLLTEAHDEIPRCGYNLDGLRVRTERQEFSPRTGSPILGVMCFANDVKDGIQRLRGHRTSWPGDPASAWAQAATTANPLVRPRPVPPVETTDDVARHQESFVRTETWGAPIFWVCLALAFAGLVASFKFAGDEIDPLLWVAAGGLLAVTVGILVFRATFYPRWYRESLEHELKTGILCDVYGSPLTIPGGDSDSSTNILIDVRAPDDQAARIAEALRVWAERPGAADSWGQEPGWTVYRALTSAELFGDDAAGGFIVRDCSVEPGGWVLVSESQEPEYPDAPYRRAELTRIAFPKKKSRRKARR